MPDQLVNHISNDKRGDVPYYSGKLQRPGFRVFGNGAYRNIGGALENLCRKRDYRVDKAHRVSTQRLLFAQRVDDSFEFQGSHCNHGLVAKNLLTHREMGQ